MQGYLTLFALFLPIPSLPPLKHLTSLTPRFLLRSPQTFHFHVFPNISWDHFALPPHPCPFKNSPNTPLLCDAPENLVVQRWSEMNPTHSPGECVRAGDLPPLPQSLEARAAQQVPTEPHPRHPESLQEQQMWTRRFEWSCHGESTLVT